MSYTRTLRVKPIGIVALLAIGMGVFLATMTRRIKPVVLIALAALAFLAFFAVFYCHACDPITLRCA